MNILHHAAVLALLALQVVRLPGAQAADAKTAFEFPAELEGFRRGEQVDFEARQPGLGFAYPYSGPSVKATVYVYNSRIENLPEGADSDAIRRQLHQAQGDVFNAYGEVKVLVKESPGTGACRTFLRVKYSFVDPRRTESDLFHSYLYLGSRKGNFVKARITYAVRGDELAQEASQESFSQALCKLVNG